jgi:hypothetical protein
MSHVQSFDSLDDMFATMRAAEQAANERLTFNQIALRDTDGTGYFVRAIPEIDLVLYGEVPSTASMQGIVGFDVAENRGRGYLTGTVFSAHDPRGEAGDTHVSEVIPVSAETFALAKAHKYPTYSMLREIEYRDLATALGREEAENRGA